MFRCVLIMTSLTMRLVGCSGHVNGEDAIKNLPTSEQSHLSRLQTVFRFSRGSYMFSDVRGVPYQYHVPRVDLKLEDMNNGRIKVHKKAYASSSHRRKRVSSQSDNGHRIADGPVDNKKVYFEDNFSWRLAAATRTLTDLESKNEHLWRRDPVALNRLMSSLDSPIFLGNFFYALTSPTEVDGTAVLSRFYYVPVLTAKYGHVRDNSNDLAVSAMKLNVFSICIEPSDAPEDVSIPLMHRLQRIIDVGLRMESHNTGYDVKTKLRENATDELAKAENHFTKEDWNALVTDSSMMTFKRLPGENYVYATIKTPFGDYKNDRFAGNSVLARTAYIRYDSRNKAYIFAYGSGYRSSFDYSKNDTKLLIFLNPKTHFKDENRSWDMCVNLWREEVHIRYGADANSRLVCLHAYLNENASTAPYFEMLPLHEALKGQRSPELLIEARKPGKPRKLRMPRQRRRSKRPNMQTAEDLRNELVSLSTPGEPQTVTTPGESNISGPPHEGQQRVSTIPGPSGLTDIVRLAGESVFFNSELLGSSSYAESGICCNDDPRVFGANSLSNGPSNNSLSAYWRRNSSFSSPADFNSFDAHPNEPFSEPVDIDWELDWLPGADLHNDAAGSSGVFCGACDTATETHDRMLSAVPTYDNCGWLTRHLNQDHVYNDMEPCLHTAPPQIDETTSDTE